MTGSSSHRQPQAMPLVPRRFLLLPLLLSLLIAPLFAPAAQASTLSFIAMEKQPVGTVIGSIVQAAGLANATQLSSLRFTMLTDPAQNGSQYISVQNQTGVLQVKSEINRDVICPSLPTCTLLFDVAVSPAEFFQIFTVQITVIDLGDFVPTFPVNTTTLAVLESVPPSSLFQLPAAVDYDSPAYGTLSYTLVPVGVPFALQWTQASLQLVVSAALDREAVDQYALTVTATGSGPHPLSGTMQVSVILLDANDVSPVFDQATYSADVWEDAVEGTAIVSVHATDYDLADNGLVYYGISSVVAVGASLAAQQNASTLFTINTNNGTISLAWAGLDREGASTYTLVVAAVDGGMPSLSSTVSVTVNVLDVNDRAPKITINTLSSDASTAQVLEHSPVGTFVVLVTATDADVGPNANVSCLLDPASEAFGLVLIQYERYKLVTLMSLDWETQSEYNVTIVCSDQGWTQLSSTVVLPVQVVDINDNSPIFTESNYSVAVLDSILAGAFITNVTAVDKDTGLNGLVSYSLSGESGLSYFTIEPSTGVIESRVAFNRGITGQYRLVVIASDHGQPPRSSNVTVYVTVVDINDVIPKFSQSMYTFFLRDNDPANQLVGILNAAVISDEYGSLTYSLLLDYIPSDASASKSFAINPHAGLLTTTVILTRDQQDVYRFLVIAQNDGFPQISSSASVQVYVADSQGTAIVVDYPAWGNSTAWVSSQLLGGQEVAQVSAHETNGTGNTQLSYSIQESPSNAFTINSATGVIYANENLIEFTDIIFELTINVTNNNVPPLWTLAYLTVNVNASIASPYATKSAPPSPNMVVVACLSAASGVVVLILLAAIAYVIHRARARRRRQRIRGRSKSIADDVMNCVVSPLEWIRGVEAVETNPNSVSRSSSGFVSTGSRGGEEGGGGRGEAGGGGGGRWEGRLARGVAVSSSSRSGRYSVAIADMARSSSQISSKGGPGHIRGGAGAPVPGEMDSATSSDSGRGQSPLYVEQFSHGADIVDDTPFSQKNLPRLSSSPHNSNYVLHLNHFGPHNPIASRSPPFRDDPGEIRSSSIHRAQDWTPANSYPHHQRTDAASKQKSVQFVRPDYKDMNRGKIIGEDSEANTPMSDTSLLSLDTAARMGYRGSHSSEVSDDGTSVTSGSYIIHHSVSDLDLVDALSLTGSQSFSVV